MGDRKNQMIINYVPGEECRVAIVESGKLEELHVERFATASRVGNIYVGRVANSEAAIQAAFVDFGVTDNGFLHVSDLHPKYFPGEDGETTERVGFKTPRRERPAIQHALRRGDEVIVQVLKEGVGTKGPTLTSYLSIPGRFLVMMPGMDNIGVSRKVEDEDQRRKMREILDQLDLPEGFGFILRTAGMARTKAELKRDLAYLMRLWKDMEKRNKGGSKPRLLYSESDLLVRSLRDLMTSEIDEVIIDHEIALHRASRFMKIVAPRGSAQLLQYKGRTPIFHAFDVEPQIQTIHAREVGLPSGGRLVIDQTEALVAIDVNSGKSRDSRNSEDNAYQTNLEAVDEICRQLRLRDMGGIVVNDLIDMRRPENRKDIEARFRERLKRDRARTTVGTISEFGILEMTRQRMRPSHESVHFTECPTCRGRGLIQKPESVTADALRELAAILDSPKVAKAEMVVAPRVAGELLSTKRRLLGRIERAFEKHADVRVSEAHSADRVSFYAYDQNGADVEVASLIQPKMSKESLIVWEQPGEDAWNGPDDETAVARETDAEPEPMSEEDALGLHPIEIDETGVPFDDDEESTPNPNLQQGNEPQENFQQANLQQVNLQQTSRSGRNARGGQRGGQSGRQGSRQAGGQAGGHSGGHSGGQRAGQGGSQGGGSRGAQGNSQRGEQSSGHVAAQGGSQGGGPKGTPEGNQNSNQIVNVNGGLNGGQQSAGQGVPMGNEAEDGEERGGRRRRRRGRRGGGGGQAGGPMGGQSGGQSGSQVGGQVGGPSPANQAGPYGDHMNASEANGSSNMDGANANAPTSANANANNQGDQTSSLSAGLDSNAPDQLGPDGLPRRKRRRRRGRGRGRGEVGGALDSNGQLMPDSQDSLEGDDGLADDATEAPARAAGSSQAGSSQAGSTQAGSPQAGSPQAGSQQGGRSRAGGQARSQNNRNGPAQPIVRDGIIFGDHGDEDDAAGAAEANSTLNLKPLAKLDQGANDAVGSGERPSINQSESRARAQSQPPIAGDVLPVSRGDDAEGGPEEFNDDGSLKRRKRRRRGRGGRGRGTGDPAQGQTNARPNGSQNGEQSGPQNEPNGAGANESGLASPDRGPDRDPDRGPDRGPDRNMRRIPNTLARGGPKQPAVNAPMAGSTSTSLAPTTLPPTPPITPSTSIAPAAPAPRAPESGLEGRQRGGQSGSQAGNQTGNQAGNQTGNQTGNRGSREGGPNRVNSNARDGNNKGPGTRDSNQRNSNQRDSNQRDSGQRDSGQRDRSRDQSSPQGSVPMAREIKPLPAKLSTSTSSPASAATTPSPAAQEAKAPANKPRTLYGNAKRKLNPSELNKRPKPE